MISTNAKDEKVIALDHIGTFRTPNGTIKVLVITIKIADNAPTEQVPETNMDKLAQAPTEQEESFTEYTNRKLEETNAEQESAQ